jgi:hypothetical protein
MNDFRYVKFVFTLISGAVLACFISYLFGMRLSDSLMVTGAVTVAGSFTFLHTMFGQNAARGGSILNQYEKVSRDMRYNIREQSGLIKETLIAGLIEVVSSIVLMLIK